MKLSSVLFLLTQIFICFQQSDSVNWSVVAFLPKAIFEVVEILLKANKIIGHYTSIKNIPHPLFDRAEHDLFSRLEIINGKLDALSYNQEARVSTISVIAKRLRFELHLNNLLDYVTRINVNYRRMHVYVREPKKIERDTLIDFAENVISHDSSSVISLLERIFAFIVPTEKGIANIDLLSTLQSSFADEGDGFRCEINQSPQQVIYTLYNTIALTELKGYTMIQFAYMILKLYNEGNFTRESQEQHERFENRTNFAILAVKNVLENVSKDVYRCDPKKHVEGQTYDQLTELIQGYIENEVDMNSEGTCGENCAFYQYTKNHGCFKSQFCAHQRACSGKILKCKYVDSDMTVCQSYTNNRRYDYVQYENGKSLGRNTGCSRVTRQVDSWWRWLFWHCSYCLCLCDDAGPNSDRYFNLRPVVSNVVINKVVTGLRFVKKNRIFHLQIQEGSLLPYGRIDEESVRWVPINAYKITDRNVHNGRDYHQMSWEKRAIDLDDLVTDENSVVTGVKFKLIGSHLNFEIQVTPFDFKNGTLIDPLNKSMWKDNPNTDSSYSNPRKRKELNNPDVPIRSPNPSIPDSVHDQFLEFVNSDLDKDVGQTTVPFIDIQPVDSLIPVPLSGAGIFHKGRYGFGGFITPKIITYDFSKHLKEPFDEKPEEEDTTKDYIEQN